jgi:sugar phosphate isomerase/epimerase
MKAPATRRSLLQRAALTGTALVLGGSRITTEAAASAGPAYTAREIADRLGISMTVYQKERLGARHVAAIRHAGIAHVELAMIPPTFDVQDRAQTAEILAECRRQKVAIASVHGNLQRRYDSPNEPTRRAAAAGLLEEIRFAEEAGAAILVAHFGTNDQAAKTVTELLEETGDFRIRLTVENMRGGLGSYAAFVDRIGSSRFGLTVDIGHLRDGDSVNPMIKRGRAGAVFAEGGPRIWHVHLHDTFNLKTKPDHRAPMHPDGLIQWGAVFAALKAIDYRGLFLFEDGRGEDPAEWVRLAATFPQSFVSRYRR